MVDLISSPEREQEAKRMLAQLATEYNGKVEKVDLAAEVWAAREHAAQLQQKLDELCKLKQDDGLQLVQNQARIEKLQKLSLDQTVLMGQVDIAVWGAREVGLERFLNPEFRRILQNQNRRTSGEQETRYESNKILHKDLDGMVARRTKESKVNTWHDGKLNITHFTSSSLGC